MKTDLIVDVHVPEILLVYLRISYPYTYKLLQQEKQSVLGVYDHWSVSNWTRKWLSTAESVFVLFPIMSYNIYPILRQMLLQTLTFHPPFTLTGVLEGIWNFSNQHTLLYHRQQTHLRSNRTLPKNTLLDISKGFYRNLLAKQNNFL